MFKVLPDEVNKCFFPFIILSENLETKWKIFQVDKHSVNLKQKEIRSK